VREQPLADAATTPARLDGEAEALRDAVFPGSETPQQACRPDHPTVGFGDEPDHHLRLEDGLYPLRRKNLREGIVVTRGPPVGRRVGRFVERADPAGVT